MIRRMYQISLTIILVFLFCFGVGAGRKKEVYKEVDLKDEKSLVVKIEFGAGELNLRRTSSKKIVEAEVSYDPGFSDFFFDYDKSKDKGELFIGTELEEEKGVNLGDMDEKNWWDISFTDRIPIDFEIDVGAAEAELDFTGLKITDLDLDIGAAKAWIQFRKPNPERISRMRIDAGACKLEIEGLGNANFKRMDFDAGVGDFTLDFSGDLKHSAVVDIEMGLGHLAILVPEDIGVRIQSNGSILSSISFDKGVFEEVEDDVWINDEYGKTDAELNFKIEVGLGAVDIEMID
ncbi:MAG: toast rack family protein [Candidatus Zixiibacteriota bacterium]